MSFNRLSNELLVMVLGKVALQKRLQLRLVSPRWLELIENACLENTSLKLFGSPKDVEMYRKGLNDVHSTDLDYWTLKDVGQSDNLMVNAEHFSDASQEICDLLARLFANVKQLIVYFRDECLWEAVPYLLEKFVSITSLSLCGRYCDDFEVVDCGPDTDEDEAEEKVSSQILEQVNSMSSLKRFDLLVDDFFTFVERPYGKSECTQYRSPPRIRKVLPQLERFSLNGSHEYSDYGDKPCSLPWDGNEIKMLQSKCTHLHLKNISYGGYRLDEYDLNVDFKYLIKTEFLQLEGISEEDEGALMSTIADVSSLRCLWLNFATKYDFGNDDMFDYLKDLTNLTELRFQSAKGVEYTEECLKMHDESTAILSVKHLSWFNFTFTNSKTKFDGKQFCVSLSAWFPNLEELFITFDIMKPSIVTKLEVNVYMFPHLTKHRFEASRQKKN